MPADGGPVALAVGHKRVSKGHKPSSRSIDPEEVDAHRSDPVSISPGNSNMNGSRSAQCFREGFVLGQAESEVVRGLLLRPSFGCLELRPETEQ
jgi:hypothetical protein